MFYIYIHCKIQWIDYVKERVVREGCVIVSR